MVRSFLLIKTQPLSEKEAFSTLSKIPEILEIHPLFGEDDILAKIEAEATEINTIIKNKIETIPGVIVSKTLNCCD